MTSNEADDEFDEPNQRESDAWRAFKAAVFGIAFVPLQFYALWLVLSVCFDPEPLRPEYRRWAIAAALLSIAYLMLATLMLRFILR